MYGFSGHYRPDKNTCPIFTIVATCEDDRGASLGNTPVFSRESRGEPLVRARNGNERKWCYRYAALGCSKCTRDISVTDVADAGKSEGATSLVI